MNHLASIDYNENGLQFGKVHNKMKKLWANLHPLEDSDTIVELGDSRGGHPIF